MSAKSPTTLESALVSSEPSPPPYDAAQERLQQCTAAYQEAEQKGSHESTEADSAAMREVGDSSSDAKVKSDWYSRAKRFARGEKTDREGVLSEIGGVVQIVMFVPRMVIGTASHIVGNAVRKVGWAVVGLGDSVVGSSRDSVFRRGRQ